VKMMEEGSSKIKSSPGMLHLIFGVTNPTPQTSHNYKFAQEAAVSGWPLLTIHD